ncbi:MAG: TatD family hydrolase [Janthinobacterium lividum]
MWIDSHCHLDAGEFAADRSAVARAAHAAGVSQIVIPAVDRGNFEVVRQLAASIDGGAYALGIHPLFTPHARDEDLLILRNEVARSLDDPRFVGIGEIGLDYFVPGLDDARQQYFYLEQLKLARDFALPVICHVRRSQDQVLKGLRRIGGDRGIGGIAHAFNGSRQQADAFVALGMRLGFGGAMTFERALRIRRLACEMPMDAIVLETDAPDISPAWLYKQRNSPEQIPRIAETLASLRGVTLEALALCTTANVRAALPRLALSSA